MRVAHGQYADFDEFTFQAEQIGRRTLFGGERNLRRLEARHAHVHRHLAVRLQARHDDAGSGFDANLGFRAQPLVVHEAHEAARAVAALLDLAAVGVEDAVAEIGIGPGGAFHQQDLVATDAEMAIGDELELGRAQIHALRNRVEHHEIVAQAMHFGEGISGGRDSRDRDSAL